MRNILPYILLFVTIAANAQTSETLVLNKKILHELATGEKHSYKLNLKANQFTLIGVIQDGIDVIIKTFGPTGNEIETFDSPNGKQGLEPVTILSSSAGIYTLEVLPIDDQEPKGKYSIEVLRSEARGSTPEKQIDQLMSVVVFPGMPGATVAVSQGSKILISKGYGLANPEYDLPNSPKTVFHIASVSKQFTAFSIAMLADEKKLSLDDDIRKYLPELPDFGQKITIRQLVHHTSGLRDQWNLLALAGWRLDDVITRNQILRLISHQQDLNFKPGDQHSYSNTGYTLMGEIVSRVTEKSFSEWTRENIFNPLGMNNTLFYDDHEKIVKNRAYSFYNDQDGLKKSVLSYANAGATSLFTTAEDLVKWSNNFQSMKVGNARIMTQMTERGVLNKGDTLDYAFGQALGSYKGLKTAAHSGGDAGYRSFLLRFPEQQYTVVVLSNYASFNPGRIAFQIADIYMKDYFKEEVKKPQAEVAGPEAVEVSDDLMKLYSGQYELQPGFVVTMRLESGKLIGQATGQPSFVLAPVSQTEFVITAVNARITFQQPVNNIVNEFTLNQNGQTVVAKRMKEFEPKSVNFDDFTGIFYCPELETRYTLSVENGKLIARHIRHDQIEFTPVSKDAFNTNQWFMGHVEFVRNEKGEVNGFKVSSGRVLNVRFDKLK